MLIWVVCCMRRLFTSYKVDADKEFLQSLGHAGFRIEPVGTGTPNNFDIYKGRQYLGTFSYGILRSFDQHYELDRFLTGYNTAPSHGPRKLVIPRKH